MNARAVLCLIFVFVPGSTCYSQDLATVYRPLGLNSASTFEQWDSVRRAVTAPTAEGNRPVLPGVTGRNLELLQDAVARKYIHVTRGSSLPVARKVLANTTQSSLPKLRGVMAEAIFLDRNPDWFYVAKPNAPQHDVWAKMPNGGRGIQTGQVKVHMSGNPAKYASDMLKDWRSGNFFVPADHVDQLRAYIKTEGDRLWAAGDSAGAVKRYKAMNRVKGIPATYTQIDRATRQAIAEARTVVVAPYIFIGVAAALLVAPTVWDLYQGDIDGAEAAYRLVKGGSVVLSAAVTDLALYRWKGWLSLGSPRGNAITVCVMLMVDTAWQVHELGGMSNALHNPEFVIHLGGSIPAAVLGYHGMVVGAKIGGAIGTHFGPYGGLIGVGIGSFVGGTAGVYAGYAGGSQGTRWALETFRPELLYKQEEAYGQNLRKGIEDSITSLQTM